MMKRIFVAIDISDEARQKANSYLENLRKDFRDLRVGWERAEKLHLTLKFLGDIDKEQLEKLKVAVEKTAKEFTNFKVELAGTGVFPNAKRARVLWLGINDENRNLLKLFELLENECEKVGFQKESKKFHPHLTIARLREPEKSQRLTEKHLSEGFEPVEFEVSEIVIYESQLQPTGSKFCVVKKFKSRKVEK